MFKKALVLYVSGMALAGSASAYVVLDKPNQLRLGSGFDFTDYKLKSDGYNFSVPKKLGLPLNFEWISPAMRVRARQTKTKYDAPAGYSPNQLEVTQRDAQVLFNIPMADLPEAFKKFSFQVGYALRSREGQRSLPANAVTSYFAHGFAFGVSHQYVASDDLIIDSSLTLVLPIHFKETIAKSGIYQNSQFVDLNVIAMYPISNRIAIGAGIGIDYQRISFNGVGENNTRGATQTQFGWSVPLQIRIYF